MTETTSTISIVDDGVLEASVVVENPPRPDAFMTLITSEDDLPGVQTLLYSIKVGWTFRTDFSSSKYLSHLLFKLLLSCVRRFPSSFLR